MHLQRNSGLLDVFICFLLLSNVVHSSVINSLNSTANGHNKRESNLNTLSVIYEKGAFYVIAVPVTTNKGLFASSNISTRLWQETFSSDFTGKYNLEQFALHHIPLVRLVLFLLYGLFAIVGLVTNLFVIVILVTVRRRALANVTNLFVLALAISDFVMCSFSMPLQVYYEMQETVKLSTSVCRFFFAGFGVPMHISCLTILLIAIDRYRIIVYPLRPRMSPLMAMLLIGLTIGVSIINSLPVALVTKSHISWPPMQTLYVDNRTPVVEARAVSKLASNVTPALTTMPKWTSLRLALDSASSSAV
ncbi:unnamed protein product, partial [Protopolystoma xenopodis]